MMVSAGVRMSVDGFVAQPGQQRRWISHVNARQRSAASSASACARADRRPPRPVET